MQGGHEIFSNAEIYTEQKPKDLGKGIKIFSRNTEQFQSLILVVPLTEVFPEVDVPEEARVLEAVQEHLLQAVHQA